MENLKKIVIIEYLINEIDLCEPKEEIYKSYGDDLYKIVDLDIKLEYRSYKERFIMKITSMEKKDILKFCENELFIIDLDKVESVLKRHLNNNDYDYIEESIHLEKNLEGDDSDDTVDYTYYF